MVLTLTSVQREVAAKKIRMYLLQNGPQLLPQFFDSSETLNRRLFLSILNTAKDIQIDYERDILYLSDVENDLFFLPISSSGKPMEFCKLVDELRSPQSISKYPYLNNKSTEELQCIAMECYCRSSHCYFVGSMVHFNTAQNLSTSEKGVITRKVKDILHEKPLSSIRVSPPKEDLSAQLQRHWEKVKSFICKICVCLLILCNETTRYLVLVYILNKYLARFSINRSRTLELASRNTRIGEIDQENGEQMTMANMLAERFMIDKLRKRKSCTLLKLKEDFCGLRLDSKTQDLSITKDMVKYIHQWCDSEVQVKTDVANIIRNCVWENLCSEVVQLRAFDREITEEQESCKPGCSSVSLTNENAKSKLNIPEKKRLDTKHSTKKASESCMQISRHKGTKIGHQCSKQKKVEKRRKRFNKDVLCTSSSTTTSKSVSQSFPVELANDKKCVPKHSNQPLHKLYGKIVYEESNSDDQQGKSHKSLRKRRKKQGKSRNSSKTLSEDKDIVKVWHLGDSSVTPEPKVQQKPESTLPYKAQTEKESVPNSDPDYQTSQSKTKQSHGILYAFEQTLQKEASIKQQKVSHKSKRIKETPKAKNSTIICSENWPSENPVSLFTKQLHKSGKSRCPPTNFNEATLKRRRFSNEGHPLAQGKKADRIASMTHTVLQPQTNIASCVKNKITPKHQTENNATTSLTKNELERHLADTVSNKSAAKVNERHQVETKEEGLTGCPPSPPQSTFPQVNQPASCVSHIESTIPGMHDIVMEKIPGKDKVHLNILFLRIQEHCRPSERGFSSVEELQTYLGKCEPGLRIVEGCWVKKIITKEN